MYVNNLRKALYYGTGYITHYGISFLNVAIKNFLYIKFNKDNTVLKIAL
jgi:hypothetical protein